MKQLNIAMHIKKNLNKTGNYSINLANPDVDYFKNILYKEMAAPNFDAVSCCTLPDKNFNYAGLINGFTNGQIEYIIGSRNAPVKELWGVSLEHYKTDTVFDNFILYKYTTTKQSNP
jgi:hypothetical protein